MSATFEGWAILELMGHRKLAGHVTEATVAGAAMIRIDVPQGDETVTQFYAPHALYALTPTTEEVARAFGGNQVAPISRWDLKTLPAHAEVEVSADVFDDRDEL